MITTSLGYDTELRWNANPESDVISSEIVWRDSISPLWQRSKRVGNVTEVTMKNLSKDDNQVAVRAIDADGGMHRRGWHPPMTWLVPGVFARSSAGARRGEAPGSCPRASDSGH